MGDYYLVHLVGGRMSSTEKPKVLPGEYSERYDARYNVETDEWIESQCSDPDCEYCLGRPERPSMAEDK